MRLLQSSEKYCQAPKHEKMLRSIPLYDPPVSPGTELFLDSDHGVGRTELISLNGKYPSRVIGENDDLHVIGKAVA